VNRSGRLLALLIAALLGAILGRVLAHSKGESFASPSPLDTSVWQVISPGLEAGILHPGRGSHLGSDALVITDHMFFRADRLVPRLADVPHRVELELGPQSHALEVLLGQPPTGMVRIYPETHGSQVVLEIRGGSLVLLSQAGEQLIGAVTPDRLELSAIDGSAHVAQILVQDGTGQPLMQRDYRSGGISHRTLRDGTVLGGMMGLMLALVLPAMGWARGAALGVLLLLPPMAVIACPSGAWLPWLERLYLVDWAPDRLAVTALQVSLIPLVVAAVGHVCRLFWSRLGPAPVWLSCTWGAAALGVLIVNWEMSAFMAAAAVWLAIPLWLVRKDSGSARVVLGLDLMSFVMVGTMGLGLGLLLATLWRLCIFIGGAGFLAERAPRPAMDVLFVLMLAVLPAVESALQHSPLNLTWDPTQLQEERPSERGWRDPLSSWVGQCGPKDAPVTRRILVAGGSSAGGAYQYKDDPEASFVAQMHLDLCASLPAGVSLQTHNFGRGNRDTFTISRTIEAMLDKSEADLVLLYVGVNDLLADQYPMSRKQREQVRSERSAALRGAAGLARRLRVVTALWLASRTLPDKDAPSVPDVPLADAAENFETIADATRARAIPLVLMTEHMRAEQYGRLAQYRQVQEAAASSRVDVDFLDVRPAFEGASDDDMLVDQNHLTRRGGQRLGVLLSETVGPVLFAQGSNR